MTDANAPVVSGDCQQSTTSKHIATVNVPENLIPEDHLPATFRLVLTGWGAASLQPDRLCTLLVSQGWMTLDSWKKCVYYRLHDPRLRFISTTGVPHSIVHGKEVKVAFDPEHPKKIGTIKAFDVTINETRIMLQFVPPAASTEYVNAILAQAGLTVLESKKSEKRADMWQCTVKEEESQVPHYIEGQGLSKNCHTNQRKPILVQCINRLIQCYYCKKTDHWSNKCAVLNKKTKTNTSTEARRPVVETKNKEINTDEVFPHEMWRGVMLELAKDKEYYRRSYERQQKENRLRQQMIQKELDEKNAAVEGVRGDGDNRPVGAPVGGPTKPKPSPQKKKSPVKKGNQGVGSPAPLKTSAAVAEPPKSVPKGSNVKQSSGPPVVTTKVTTKRPPSGSPEASVDQKKPKAHKGETPKQSVLEAGNSNSSEKLDQDNTSDMDGVSSESDNDDDDGAPVNSNTTEESTPSASTDVGESGPSASHPVHDPPDYQSVEMESSPPHLLIDEKVARSSDSDSGSDVSADSDPGSDDEG